MESFHYLHLFDVIIMFDSYGIIVVAVVEVMTLNHFIVCDLSSPLTVG